MGAEAFTPVEALCGGLLIGLVAAVQLLCFGRVLGFSGIFAATLQLKPATWRSLILCGMVLGGGVAWKLVPNFPPSTLNDLPAWLYGLGGFFVGFGTNVGCGCTSGHGIVGLARFSPRSLVAVLTFMVAGGLSTYMVQTATSEGGRSCAVAPLQWPDDAGRVVGTTVGAGGALLLCVLLASLNPSAALPRAAVYLCSGVTSAVALALSGMTNQRKVQGFLDVTGKWDPSLAFVMGGGLLVSLVAHAVARRSSKPLLAADWAFPVTAEFGSPDSSITPGLVFGSLCFGLGWGAVGLCPGPAFVGQSFPLDPTAGKGAFLFPFWLVACAVGTLFSDHCLGRVQWRAEILAEANEQGPASPTPGSPLLRASSRK